MWPHVTTCSEGCINLWVDLLVVSHQLAKFCEHWPRCSRDITDLIFRMILQDHVIKKLCEFMEQSSSLYIPTLPSLVATSIVVVYINTYTYIYIYIYIYNSFNLSHDLTRRHNYIVMWLYGQTQLKSNHHPAKFCAISIVIMEMQWF